MQLLHEQPEPHVHPSPVDEQPQSILNDGGDTPKAMIAVESWGLAMLVSCRAII